MIEDINGNSLITRLKKIYYHSVFLTPISLFVFTVIISILLTLIYFKVDRMEEYYKKALTRVIVAKETGGLYGLENTILNRDNKIFQNTIKELAKSFVIDWDRARTVEYKKGKFKKIKITKPIQIYENCKSFEALANHFILIDEDGRKTFQRHLVEIFTQIDKERPNLPENIIVLSSELADYKPRSNEDDELFFAKVKLSVNYTAYLREYDRNEEGYSTMEIRIWGTYDPLKYGLGSDNEARQGINPYGLYISKFEIDYILKDSIREQILNQKGY